MDPEQLKEFCALRTSVYDGLRLGRYIDRDRVLQVCQFLILPAFENPTSWDVVQAIPRVGGPQTRLYRSCWRMDVDDEVMSSPVERLKHPRPLRPTIEVGWAPVDPARIEALVARFRAVKVPLAVAQPHSGCDGISYELSLGDFFCSARVGWWCDLPDEWRDLGPLVAELEQLFDQAWDARPDSGTPSEPAEV